MKAFDKAKLGGKYLFNHALQEMDVDNDEEGDVFGIGTEINDTILQKILEANVLTI